MLTYLNSKYLRNTQSFAIYKGANFSTFRRNLSGDKLRQPQKKIRRRKFRSFNLIFMALLLTILGEIFVYEI